MALLNERIAVANATGLDLDSYLSCGRLGYLTFNEFEWPAWAGDLDCAHLWHKNYNLALLGCGCEDFVMGFIQDN
jgi:hypothetical protein